MFLLVSVDSLFTFLSYYQKTVMLGAGRSFLISYSMKYDFKRMLSLELLRDVLCFRPGCLKSPTDNPTHGLFLSLFSVEAEKKKKL